MNSNQQTPKRAVVPWSELKLDLALLFLPVLFVVGSLICDRVRDDHDYFQRSGAVMVLFAGLLAYRGLNKYWVKAERSFDRGYWLRTSRNQTIIDFGALVMSIVGTAIWGYGDKLYAFLFQ